MKKYYKVVRNDWVNRGLISARSGNVQYKVGEWVNAPENTRLFVFDSLQKAKEFCRDQPDEIYECQIKGGVKGFGAYRSSDNETFWKMFNAIISKKKKFSMEEIEKHIILSFTPAILAKSVKLTKKVG